MSFIVCVACNMGTSIALPNVASIKTFHKFFFAQPTMKIVLSLMAASCRTTTNYFLVGIIEWYTQSATTTSLLLVVIWKYLPGFHCLSRVFVVVDDVSNRLSNKLSIFINKKQIFVSIIGPKIQTQILPFVSLFNEIHLFSWFYMYRY